MRLNMILQRIVFISYTRTYKTPTSSEIITHKRTKQFCIIT